MTISPPSSAVLRLIPAALTLCLAGVAGALGAFYSWPTVVLCLATSPVPLLLLWLTRNEPAPADRIAAVDAERVKRGVSRPAPAPARAA